MPFTLLIKAADHGGFLVNGPQSPLDTGPDRGTQSDGNGTLIVFHPPPPGPDKVIPLQHGDKITVLANGDLFITTQNDPSNLRCTEKDWPKDWPPQSYQTYHTQKS